MIGKVQQDGPMTGSPSLVVKCTSGAEAPERCSQAFTVASTALAAGADVSLWLTGEAVWFAVAGRAESFELPHAAPLAALRDAVLADGRLTVCTQCAARRDLTQDALLPGVRIAGAATFVDEALRGGTQALVY
jgi:predicted peroxiredoxin